VLNQIPPGAFYVSSILQGHEAGMRAFFSAVPFSEPPYLNSDSDVHCDDGVWLFVGRNSTRDGCEPITGRPEHTDAVDHSGTWHMQLSGSKTWLIRPIADEKAWKGTPPSIKGYPNAVQGEDGEWRLRIDTQEGDLLFVNTRLWWHQTILGPQSAPGLSISYARDFYLSTNKSSSVHDVEKGNMDGLHARSDVRPGDIVMLEHEIPPQCPLPMSATPNCVLREECGGLIALQHILIGEILSVPISVSDSEEEYEEYEYDPATGQMTKVRQGGN